MKKVKLSVLFSSILLGSLSFSSVAQANGRLVVYCSAQNLVCEKETQAFSKKYGVKTSFIRHSSGSALAKIEAEKNNPQADILYGGPLDTHLQAGELGLLDSYSFPKISELLPQFQQLGNGKSSVVYMGVLGFGVNTERLKRLGISEVPKCWSDLLNPKLKNEIQMADPQSSGTAYTAISTFVQLWGENKAFDYLKKVDKNISQYPKAGTAPSRNAARGETTVGIGFLHNYSFEKENGAPIELVVPCEGTGYELGGISVIKNARNVKNAQLFVDWVMSKESQELSWTEAQSHHVPTNVNAIPSPYALKPSDLNLINYDFNKFGSNENRRKLIDKWITEVKLAK